MICLFLLALCVSAVPIPWEPCSSTSLFVFEALTADPWPPAAGKNINVHLKGKLNADITAGTFTLDISLGPMSYPSQTTDICQIVPCPIRAGPFEATQSMPVPPMPKGLPPVGVKLTAVNQNKQTIFCGKFSMKLSSSNHVELLGLPDLPDFDPAQWVNNAHDFLAGFFRGLDKDGSGLVDKLKDPTQYINKDDLARMVQTIQTMHWTNISAYSTMLTTGLSLFSEFQQAVAAVGDMKDSVRLQKFVQMVKTRTGLFGLCTSLLMDSQFRGEALQIVSTWVCVRSTTCSFKDLGTKVGEMTHSILRHVTV